MVGILMHTVLCRHVRENENVPEMPVELEKIHGRDHFRL